MSLDADIVIERRRLKQRVTIWRLTAIAAVVAAGIFAASRASSIDSGFGLTPHVARIKVDGIISEDRERQKMLEKLATTSTVKAVIVSINSPGGTTTGGEALYNGLRRISEEKPVVAVFGTAATSAAYMTGLASDHIVARGNTITGSVGVIFQWANVSELLDKIGVKVEDVKSGALKAVPNPFQPTDENARRVAAELVNEAQDWFLSLVKERRKLDPGTLEAVRTGRVFSGRQAAANGMIDALGDESTARAWLKDRDVPESLSVVDWEPESSTRYSLLRIATVIGAAIWGPSAQNLLSLLGESRPLEAQTLDGLISVWQLQKPQ